MLITIALGIAMTLAVIIFHYWALRAITRLSHRSSSHFFMSSSVVMCIFVLHLVEIAWYASHLYILNQWWGIAGFAKDYNPVFSDFLHMAASGYTTLGLVSPTPTGNLALAIDIISLTGFMMLTWSATYYYNIFSNSHSPDQ